MNRLKLFEEFSEIEEQVINTLEIRKELGETNFPDENIDYEDFTFNNRISERFLERMKEILRGNTVSFKGYCYRSVEKERFYECEDLLVDRITINLNNVLCIYSKEWPTGERVVIGGAVDERHPITVKIKPRIYRADDPYGEEDWDMNESYTGVYRKGCKVKIFKKGSPYYGMTGYIQHKFDAFQCYLIQIKGHAPFHKDTSEIFEEDDFISAGEPDRIFSPEDPYGEEEWDD